VWREGAVLVVVGLAVGTVAAVATTRVASSLLFGVAPGDPMSLLIAIAGMTAVTLVSAIAPIRRAARVGDSLVAHLSP
jgi:ABC-type antimicrobial peptide transport system permease subunit